MIPSPLLRRAWAATASAFLLFFLSLGLGTTARAQHTLVSDTAEWRVYDQGDISATGWTANSYNDSSWKKAVGKIGWGISDADTVISQPPASPTSGYTVYLRTKFFLKKTGSGGTATYSGLNGAAISSLYLAGLRDDGVVVHINGTMLTSRSNMPTGAVNFYTSATTNITNTGFTMTPFPLTAAEWKAACVDGENTLCIEVHQHTPSANPANAADMLAQFRLLGNSSGDVINRDPYVNDFTIVPGSPATANVTIRWRTTANSYGRVWYDTAGAGLTAPISLFPTVSPAPARPSVTQNSSTMDHVVTLTGLTLDRTYTYALGHFSTFAGTTATSTYASHQLTFRTPADNTSDAAHLLVMGNSGGGNQAIRGTLDHYRSTHTTQTLSGLLLTGDNAWAGTTDALVTTHFFTPFGYALSHLPGYISTGDRDTSFLFATQNLPNSNSRYYSFNRGCVHVVCLNSQETNATIRNNMLTWLDADLDAAVSAGQWIIAYFHDSPYTKGDKTSEASPAGDKNIWMRQNALDILEAHDVDVVFTGDSHTYERSPLITGARGSPTTTVVDANFVDNSHGRDLSSTAGFGPYIKPVTKAAGQGAVYVALGSSSGVVGTYGITGTTPLDHPAMLPLNGSTRGLLDIGFGTVDASSTLLQFKFWETGGTFVDAFSILRGALTLTAVEHQGGAKLTFSDPTMGSTAKLQIQRSTDGATWNHLAFIAATSTQYVDNTADFSASSIYHYRYRFVTESGGTIITRNNLWSNSETVSRRDDPPMPGAAPSNATVRVSWNNNPEITTYLVGATHVVIQRSADGGSFSDIITRPISPGYYDDTPGDTAEYYTYRIKAVWPAWVSGPGASGYNAQRAPATITLTDVAGRVQIGGYSNAHVLQRSTDGVNYSPITLYNGSDVADVNPGNTYYYQGTYAPSGYLRRSGASGSISVITSKPSFSVSRAWNGPPYGNNAPRIVFSNPGSGYVGSVSSIVETATGTPITVTYSGSVSGGYSPVPYSVAYTINAHLHYYGWSGNPVTFDIGAEAVPSGVLTGYAVSSSELRAQFLSGSVTMHSVSLDNNLVYEEWTNGVYTPISQPITIWVTPSYTNRNYTVSVHLTNNDLMQSYVETISIPAICAIPGDVNNMAVNSNGSNSCSISFTYGDTPGLPGFKIQRADGMGGWINVATIPYNTSDPYITYTHYDYGLDPGTYYIYRVVAYGDGGSSPGVVYGATTDP